MANLIELVKGHFTDDLIERLGPFLGVDAEQAHKIADSVIPALLGAVSAKAGEGGLLELIQSYVGNGFDFTKTWSPAGGLVGLVEKGHPIVNSLFGDQVKESVAAVAKAAGTTDHEARKALNLAAPGLLETLASSLGATVSSAGLAGLLDANKDSILEKAGGLGLPFDLAAAVGGLAAGSSSASVSTPEAPVAEKPKAPRRITVGNVEEVKEAVVAPVAATAPAAAPVVNPKVATESSQPLAAVASSLPTPPAPATRGNSFVLAGILGLGLIGLWLILGTPGCPKPDAASLETSVSTTAASASAPKLEDPPFPVAPDVNPNVVVLDGGVQLDAAPDGIEHKLVDFIKSDKAPDKTTWFSFDRLYFDTAKATLKPDSDKQLKNIVEIMKAFPKVKLKIGGYTDNVGDDAQNLKLSLDRANATKGKLVAIGVDASRLDAEGYGEAFPVADNATEDGRSKNRRIDVRVTEK